MARLAGQLDIGTVCDLQDAFSSGRSRAMISAIVRAIPASFTNLIRMGSLVQVPSKIVWFGFSSIVEARKISTRMVKESLISIKFPNLGVKIEKIHKRADWAPPGIE